MTASAGCLKEENAMKRWMACILALCLCLSPVLACAQPISTEAVLVQLLAKLAGQFEEPSFAAALETQHGRGDVCFALDDQDLPDFSAGLSVNGGRMQVDADAAGFRFSDDLQKIGVTLDTLLRVLTTDENGNSLSPDVRDEDIQMLSKMVSEILGAAMTAVAVEQTAPAQVQDGQEAPQPMTNIVVDVSKMLAALDSAVPAVLERYADALNEMLARNRVQLANMLGSTELPDMHAVAQSYPQGLLAGLVPDGTMVMIAAQGSAWEMSAVLGGAEIARMSCKAGRIQGALGVNGEYVFDSDDLKQILQMAAKLPSYIREEALLCSLWSEFGTTAAHFKFDTIELVRDAVTGVVCIVRDHQAQIDALIARYAPWLNLAGMQVGQLPQAQAMYEELRANQDRICNEICNGIMRWMQRQPQLRQMLGTGMPWADANLYVQARKDKPLEIVLEARMSGAEAALTVSGHAVSGSYTLNPLYGKTSHGYVSGFVSAAHAELVLGHQQLGRTDARWTVSAKKDGDCWTAVLYDMSGTQKAELCVTPQWIRLTGGSATVRLIDTGKGYNFVLNDGNQDVHAQWYAYDGVWRADLYANGMELSGMTASERNRETWRFTYRPHGSQFTYELQLGAGMQSLLVCAGKIYGKSLAEGLELNAQWSDQLPRLNVQFIEGDNQFRLNYLTGDLEAGWRDAKLGDQWILSVKDKTAPDEDGNVTRAELNGRRSVAVVQDGSDGNPGEPRQQMEPYAWGWTVHTVPAGEKWTVQMESDDGQAMTLTLDFAAVPETQDLTGYTWLNDAQARNLLDELANP